MKSTNNETFNSESPLAKKKKLFILLGVLVLLIIIFIITAQGEKSNKNSANNSDNQTLNNPQSSQELEASTTPGTEGKEGSSTPQTIALESAVAVVPGTNVVSKDKKVLTSSGEVTKSDAAYNSPLAPQTSMPVAKESLSAEVMKIDVSTADGFIPNSFTVKAGAAVTLSLTNKDSDRSSALAFTDPLMSAVIINTRPAETRAVTFNAPSKTGSYQFIDGIPGHNAQGTMIVE